MADRITEADYDRVRDLHANGLGRNAIAEQMGRSGRTVSRIAAELGLTFDRERTKAATAAKVIDAKARRAALALALLDDAALLRAQLWSPAKAFNFGGKENTYNEVTLDEPTFADKRNIAQAVSVLLDRSIKLDAYDKGDGSTSGVDAWLAAMTGSDR